MPYPWRAPATRNNLDTRTHVEVGKAEFTNIVPGSAGGWHDLHWMSPTDGTRFPRLALVAASYAQYRWRKCKVTYVSTVPTTAAGTLSLSLFYDRQDGLDWYTIADEGLASRTLVANGRSVTGPVGGQGETTGLSVSADVSLVHNRVPWLLAGAIPSGSTEPSTFNQVSPLHFGVSVYGIAGTVGKIIVEYEIEFIIPYAPPISTVIALAKNHMESLIADPDVRKAFMAQNSHTILVEGSSDKDDPKD